MQEKQFTVFNIFLLGAKHYNEGWFTPKSSEPVQNMFNTTNLRYFIRKLRQAKDKI